MERKHLKLINNERKENKVMSAKGCVYDNCAYDYNHDCNYTDQCYKDFAGCYGNDFCDRDTNF